MLRSTVAIDPIVRQALAQALSPNGEQYSKARSRLSKLQAGELVRKMRTQRKKLQLGQEADDVIGMGESRTDAETIVAERRGCSPEKVKKALNYARKFAAWDKDQAVSDGDSLQNKVARQVLFHTAAIQKIDPADHAAQMKAGFDTLDRSQSGEVRR